MRTLCWPKLCNLRSALCRFTHGPISMLKEREKHLRQFHSLKNILYWPQNSYICNSLCLVKCITRLYSLLPLIYIKILLLHLSTSSIDCKYGRMGKNFFGLKQWWTAGHTDAKLWHQVHGCCVIVAVLIHANEIKEVFCEWSTWSVHNYDWWGVKKSAVFSLKGNCSYVNHRDLLWQISKSVCLFA